MVADDILRIDDLNLIAARCAFRFALVQVETARVIYRSILPTLAEAS